MSDIRFEIILNGTSVCMSSVEGFGVMGVGVTYVRRDPEKYSPEPRGDWSTTLEEWARPSVGISGSALANGVRTCDFDTELKIGDEVTIRILGPEEPRASSNT